MNPFLSNTFITTWEKHFLKRIKSEYFKFLPQVPFYKSKIPGLYINSGKNLTKGVQLNFSKTDLRKEKNKCFLVYDVIDYELRKTDDSVLSLANYAIKQYPGYLINLSQFNSLEDYLTKNFKKSSRYKLRKYKKRLEESFSIRFEAFTGLIDREQYDSIFSRFRKLLEKRFEDKQITNNNLDLEEWNFYFDVVYPLILEKKAVLFVLYNNEKPISITLGYLSDKRIYDAITVFDIDYTKFHLGSIKIMYLIDWSIKNKWEMLDFSKGHYEYKTRWANKKFDFYYHLWFDKNSIKATLIAKFIKAFFTFKQYLRDRNINEKLHRLTYKLKSKNVTINKEFSLEKINLESIDSKLNEIPLFSLENNTLRRACFEYLYLYPEKESNLKIYQINSEENRFLIKGISNHTLVTIV